MLGLLLMYCDLFWRLVAVSICIILVVIVIYIGLYFAILRKYKILREIFG